MAPISTPSTLTKIKSPSTSTTSTPQQARKNISPIRFPTPEPDKLLTSPSLGGDSSNLSLSLNAPQINITKTITRNPRDIKLTEQNLQSEPTNLDHLPRRSYSYTSTNSSNHKRGAQSLGLLLNNRNQDHQQNKRHHVENKVDNFAAGMAENIKQIIVNVRQDVHNQPNPSAKRTRSTMPKACQISTWIKMIK